MPAASRIGRREEDNASRPPRRIAKAEKRVVKTRHPPASFASRGPEPFGVRSSVARRWGGARMERCADGHEARASGRVGGRKLDSNVGNTRRSGVLEEKCSECRRRFGRIVDRDALRAARAARWTRAV